MSEEERIRTVLESMIDSFSQLDVASWLDNFHQPCMIVLPDTAVSPRDAVEARRLMSPMAESLRARGFTRSSMDSCRIRLLTPRTAVASATFTRFADDEILEELGATYVLQKRDGRWGVLLVTAHGPDVGLVQA